MAAVGLMGNNAGDRAPVFSRMCQTAGYHAVLTEMVNLNKFTANDKILIACINENRHFAWPPQINVLALPDAPGTMAAAEINLVKELTPDDFLIINADKREIFTVLAHCRAKLVTYGFNAKACVTASSVTEQALQICVQRAIPSLHGHVYEPQEFHAERPTGVSPHTVLGAVTLCIVCGTLPGCK